MSRGRCGLRIPDAREEEELSMFHARDALADMTTLALVQRYLGLSQKTSLCEAGICPDAVIDTLSRMAGETPSAALH